MNDNDLKREAIIESASVQFRSLLESNFAAIAKAATESFVDDENQAEPIAKASFSVEFDALSNAPKVSVKVRWTAAFKDESEQEIDPLQIKLGLKEEDGK